MAGTKQLAVAALLVLAVLVCVHADPGYDFRDVYVLKLIFKAVGTADPEVFGPEDRSSFGKGWVFDYSVVIKDKEVGRYSGLYFNNDSVSGSFRQYLSAISFTEGEYKGSSITLAGQSPVDPQVKEYAVTGGTGYFKFAKGSAQYTKLSDGSYDVKLSLKDVHRR